MKETNKVKTAMTKTAKQIPIIAWAVELDGKIHPTDVCPTREYARLIRNEMLAYGCANKAHVRKVVLQVIPGR